VSQLRERVGRALGALEDLDFFLRESSEARQGTDLVALAQRVSREFVADQSVGVRLALGDAAIRASVSPVALMDALYLVLHNAARFGGGQTVDLSVTREGGLAKITVRDHGTGFTEEAFKRAFDPFYSTSEDGLGLGLPHARKLLESMGGHIELRNVPGGGAEVEMSVPAA
jgi:signal transduction histidine kinase